MDEFDQLKNKIKEDESLRLFTPSELFPKWAKHVSDETGMIKINIPRIDEDKRYRYKGTVMAMIGYGGTKKSLLALNSSIEAIFNCNCTVVYSSMEMSDIMKLNRILDTSIELDNGKMNPSYYIENEIKKDPKKFTKIVQQSLDDLYKGRMLLNFKPRATVKDYEKMIQAAIAKTGRCDILVVDGLSMMGGNNSNETAQYSVNSGELKELANKYNVWIPLICHCSKGGTKHMRDVSRFVRGSEKILDNVDDILCSSLILDPELTSDAYDVYLKNKGYWWYYNKRGSGNEIAQIYDFNGYNLHMTPCDDDPALAEYSSGRNKRGEL